MYGGLLTLARGIPIIALFIAATLLPEDGFGRISIVVTAIATASLLSDSGLDTAATWLLARTDQGVEFGAIVSSLVLVRMALAAVAVLAMLGPQASVLVGGSDNAFMLLAFSVAAGMAMAYCSALRIQLRVRGHGEVETLLVEKLSAGVLFIILVILLKEELLNELWVYPACCLIGAVAAALGRRLQAGSPTFTAVRRMLSAAAPFVVTTVAAALVWRSPVFLLGTQGAFEEAGFFALASYPIILLSSVSVLSAPLLLLQGRVNQVEKRHFQITALVGVVAAVALIIVAAVGSSGVFPLPVATASLATMAYLAPALVPLWLNPQLSTWLRTRVGLWAPTLPSIAGAVVGIGVILWLIPTHGSKGAAIGIVTAESLALFLYCELRRREPSRIARGKNDA